MAAGLDGSGLEVLSPDECLALLGRAVLGRVVFTVAALPAVLPLNYLLADGLVYVRTAARSRLAAAAAGDVVAFEVDEVGETGAAWSVVVTGRLTVVREAAERARVDALGLRSWVPAGRDVVLRLTPELVTGRRLPSAALSAASQA